jgi:hypothetical protein
MSWVIDALRFVQVVSTIRPFPETRAKAGFSIQETRKSMLLRDLPEASTSSDSLKKQDIDYVWSLITSASRSGRARST